MASRSTTAETLRLGSDPVFGFQPKPHFGRCYEAAQMPMGRICVAHSGPKVPWPRLLTRPRGCTKTCGMPKAVHGAVPNPFRMVPGLRCTISSGGVIPRACFSGLSPRLGYTFIRNCNSCVRVINANQGAITVGPRFCPRTTLECLGNKPVFPIQVLPKK